MKSPLQGASSGLSVRDRRLDAVAGRQTTRRLQKSAITEVMALSLVRRNLLVSRGAQLLIIEKYDSVSETD